METFNLIVDDKNQTLLGNPRIGMGIISLPHTCHSDTLVKVTVGNTKVEPSKPNEITQNDKLFTDPKDTFALIDDFKQEFDIKVKSFKDFAKEAKLESNPIDKKRKLKENESEKQSPKKPKIIEDSQETKDKREPKTTEEWNNLADYFDSKALQSKKSVALFEGARLICKYTALSLTEQATAFQSLLDEIEPLIKEYRTKWMPKSGFGKDISSLLYFCFGYFSLRSYRNHRKNITKQLRLIKQLCLVEEEEDRKIEKRLADVIHDIENNNKRYDIAANGYYQGHLLNKRALPPFIDNLLDGRGTRGMIKVRSHFLEICKANGFSDINFNLRE